VHLFLPPTVQYLIIGLKQAQCFAYNDTSQIRDELNKSNEALANIKTQELKGKCTDSGTGTQPLMIYAGEVLYEINADLRYQTNIYLSTGKRSMHSYETTAPSHQLHQSNAMICTSCLNKNTNL
jgi:hypothetical protein